MITVGPHCGHWLIVSRETLEGVIIVATKLYHVTFKYQAKVVCTKLERASTPDDASLQVELRLISLFPSVDYDEVIVKEVWNEGA